MSVMETEVVHLNSASLDGHYVLKESRDDGTILLAALDTTEPEMRQRLGLQEISQEQFQELFGDLPDGPS